jgi:broad specificity phosphatase PhoE
MALVPPVQPVGQVEAPREPRPGLGAGTRIWLVRHAEVEAGAARFAYGDADVPLSQAGLQRTEEVGCLFAGREISRVLSSPLPRALAMGRAIANSTGAALVVDDRLREMSRGTWQGLELEEYRRRWHAQTTDYWNDPWRWCGHGGESDEVLTRRTWAALEEALPTGGTLVFTIHGQVLRSIVSAALGLSAGRSHALRHDTGRAALLVDGQRGFELALANATPGIDPLQREGVR